MVLLASVGGRQPRMRLGPAWLQADGRLRGRRCGRPVLQAGAGSRQVAPEHLVPVKGEWGKSTLAGHQELRRGMGLSLEATKSVEALVPLDVHTHLSSGRSPSSSPPIPSLRFHIPGTKDHAFLEVPGCFIKLPFVERPVPLLLELASFHLTAPGI